MEGKWIEFREVNDTGKTRKFSVEAKGGEMETKIITESRIEGDVIFDGKIIFEVSCCVTGDIVGGDIKAGGGIEAEWIFSFTFSVTAKYIVTKYLPFWRNYWADMPPLKKWRDKILDDDICWDEYPKMLTRKEKEKICAWNGWHWILRAQLEMYLGLKKKYVCK